MNYNGAEEYFFWTGFEHGVNGKTDKSREIPWSDKNKTAKECSEFYKIGNYLGLEIGGKLNEPVHATSKK